MNQHYYYSKDGKLHGPLPVFPHDSEGYVSNAPVIPSSGFTEEGVYPEDRIEWRYEFRKSDSSTIAQGWIETSKDFFDMCRDSHRRRVAVLKDEKDNPSNSTPFADMGNPITESIPPNSGELQDHETFGFIAETYAMGEFNHHHECEKHMIAYNGFMSGINYLLTGSLEPKPSLSNEANPHMRKPSPSVDSPEPTAGDGWKYDYKFLKELTKRVNDTEHGEGLSMEEVESVLLAINFQSTLSKTDKDAAEKYAESHLSSTGWDAQAYVKHNAFLAGCQHVRGQQGDAVALCDCELSEKCKAGIYKQSEREPCKKIIQLIAEEIKNTWSEVYNKRWSANPKEGTAGEIDYVPFVKNFMPRLYDLFTSRPGDLQQEEDQQRKLWEEVAYSKQAYLSQLKTKLEQP